CHVVIPQTKLIIAIDPTCCDIAQLEGTGSIGAKVTGCKENLLHIFKIQISKFMLTVGRWTDNKGVRRVFQLRDFDGFAIEEGPSPFARPKQFALTWIEYDAHQGFEGHNFPSYAYCVVGK